MLLNMKLDSYVFTLWIFAWILCIQEQECCRFGPGLNCGFPCRCTGANKCDTQTGSCIGGSQCQSVLPDGYGWRGAGCRIGNVAYGKTNVTQSGKYYYYSADLAVDGDTTPYITNNELESCSHPLTVSDTFAWWWVDLGDVFTIQNVILVNRLVRPGDGHSEIMFRERSTDYDIKIGNTSDRSQQTLCFHQDKFGDDVQPIETIRCDGGDMVGRYVSFTRTGGRDPDQAAICEFIVMGYKTIECHQNDCIGYCYSSTGCQQCKAGKMLPDCKDECPDGYWGVNCASTCGMCKDGVVCDKVTGSCGYKCESLFIPELCTEQLMLPPEPVNLTLADISSDSASILWDTFNGFDQAIQPYFYFTVQYRRKYVITYAWYTSTGIPLSTDQSFRYELLDLNFNTEYEVQIVPYRALNGLTEAGIIEITEFKTLCIGPEIPPTPSVHGTPDRFTITWKDPKSVPSGCDRLESAAVLITCENSTDTLLNETYDIWIVTNPFTYETTNAMSCMVALSVTNNAGFSSVSGKTFVTEATTTVTDSFKATQQYRASGPNITAIIVGSVAGVVVLILVAVIVILVLRIHRNMPPPDGAKTYIDTAGKSNPVYENTTVSDNDDMKSNTNPPVEYASVEDTNTATAKVEVSVAPMVSYENTKVPESQYASLDDSHKNTTKPSPVYQELK